jgi:glucan biosynthesis protein C
MAFRPSEWSLFQARFPNSMKLILTDRRRISMDSDAASQKITSTPQEPIRLHYLDWLRVLAIFMVFLFHAVHPFDFGDWQVKNPEQSETITIILTIMSLWGMPFFFLVAGSGSWFALERRTAHQYISERIKRLLIPFVVGTFLFSPIQMYLEWKNKVQNGVLFISFPEYVDGQFQPFNPLTLHYPGFTPRWFGFGFHLWFLAFLFFFALITLPLFRWLKGETGKRLVTRMASLCEKRGGILLFILPLVVVQLIIRPIFPIEHDWGDFIFQMCFFILGYILYADPRFTRALRRDWWLLLSLGMALLLSLLGMYLSDIPVMDWGETPSEAGFYLVYSFVTCIAFCFCLTMLFVGMRFLDFTNKWLRYAQEAVLPFFILHQPAIVVLAFFVVQWDASIAVKLPVVVLGSFIISLGLYEAVIRRIQPMRALFGMKVRRRPLIEAA